MHAPPYIRLAVAAAFSAAAASPAPALQQQVDPLDPFHCIAHPGYYNEVELEEARPWTVIAGTLVFHSVNLDCGCRRAGVSVLFSDAEVDPNHNDGNGISAVVRDGDPGRIHVLMMNGEQKSIGDYAYGTPVPFKIAFDDERGTMRIESGKFAMTAKPARLRRSAIHIPCLSADVSVVELHSE